MRPDWPPLKKICHAQWLQVTSVPVVCHCALPESSSGLQTSAAAEIVPLACPRPAFDHALGCSQGGLRPQADEGP